MCARAQSLKMRVRAHTLRLSVSLNETDNPPKKMIFLRKLLQLRIKYTCLICVIDT